MTSSTVNDESTGDQQADSVDLEIAALSAVIKALSPLEPKSRQWVFDSASRKFGIDAPASDAASKQNDGGIERPNLTPTDHEGSSNPKVQKWLKKGGLEQDQLDAVFHKNGNQYDLIASDVPGKSKKEQTINAYVLVGASKFLESGDATFTDKEAREFCETIGCYDGSNHSKYMADKGNLIAGNKNTAWTLTNPGLNAAISVINQSQ